ARTAPARPSFQAQTYTVLMASSGVSGTFTLAGTGGTASVIYGTNDVMLTVTGYRAGAALPPAAWNALIGLTGTPLANQLNALTG
ncbi:hypothetical protein, partial [Raoultella ornithinolytica]|uniref:hypothetical protein n=1 Tax=Raoultella ornithinolytica TaxID=54291 RepID=UPI0013DB91B4